MRIETATGADVRTVALAMRERDFTEFSAVNAADTREGLAEALTAHYGGGREDVLAVFDRDEPVAIAATIEWRPRSISLLFFATDAFPKVALGFTRFVVRELFPRYKAAGIHRIEAISLAGYSETHRWLETLGLRQETGPMMCIGKRGEAFVQFAWFEVPE